jgi:pimeloyl-ACP methyl ester carboxylesterase
MAQDSMTHPAVRPFRVDVPEEDLDDLRRRIAATRWPSKELFEDRSQGVQLATIQELARYWASDYDWRKAEAKLNALPQFTTEIDGVDIHFIHVRSQHENALPLIMTHGWPGSVVELLDTVGPLTDPTAHGGTPEDAFDLVLPSLPGYGFSAEPAELVWDAGRTARAWAELMRRLGYTRYVAQGGDVGALITDAMGRQAPEGQPAGHLTRDNIVDNITLYWLTGTGASAARSYWEDGQALAAAQASGQAPLAVSVPVGFTTFPGEIWRTPRSWVEAVYSNLTYFNEVEKGGHFAAWEEPQLFSEEVRAAFRSLR